MDDNGADLIGANVMSPAHAFTRGVMTVFHRYWWVIPSVTLNCHFMVQGDQPWPMFLVTVSAVIFGAITAVKAVDSFRSKRYLICCVAWLLFGVTLTFNMIVSIGAVAVSRDSFTGRRSVTIQSQEILQNRNAQLSTEVGRLKAVTLGDSPDMVRSVIAKLQADPAFARSKNCAKATWPDSQTLCGRIATESGRLAAAAKADGLEAEQKRIWAEMTALEGKPSSADPQISTLALLIGMGTEMTQSSEKLMAAGLTAFVAIMAELMAAFGPIFSSITAPAKTRAERIAAPTSIALPMDVEPPALINAQQEAPAPEIGTSEKTENRRGLALSRQSADAKQVANWLTGRIAVRKGETILASVLYADFEVWCQGHGETPLNPTRFGNAVKERLKKKKSGGHVRYQNISFKVQQRTLRAV